MKADFQKQRFKARYLKVKAAGEGEVGYQDQGSQIKGAGGEGREGCAYECDAFEHSDGTDDQSEVRRDAERVLEGNLRQIRSCTAHERENQICKNLLKFEVSLRFVVFLLFF